MDRATFQRVLGLIVWIPFVTALILAVTLIAEVRYQASRAAWVEHTDRVIAIALHIFRIRVDQETGLRAYLLTHHKRFLEPFEEGRTVAGGLEKELHELVSDNPSQQVRNEVAVAAASDWSTWAGQAIAMQEAGKDTSNLEFQLHGKELMDKYRAARTEFVEEEEKLRDQRLNTSRRTVHWVTLSVAPLCILGAAILAVAGRKQTKVLIQSFNTALDEVRDQREWFRTTLTSIGDAVIATDEKGAITFMNPVAESVTGWGIQEAAGRQLPEVFRIVNEMTRETAENPVDKVRNLNKVVGLANHTILINRNGQDVVIEDSGAPIYHPDGGMAGIVVVFRDITQDRAMEMALRSNERLALAGRLSASIAHEIHNPLDTVGNLLFLIHQKTTDRPEVHKLIKMAQTELHHVTDVSKNMLSLHRESRSAAPIDISKLLEGVVALINQTIAKGRRKIETSLGFGGPIEGFPAELRQVFTNIIKNAVEATKDGGNIQIRSAAEHEAGTDGVLVQVTDNGTGIPEEMRSKLFSPFATTKQDGGTGLGLWVSRSIVERHGGRVRMNDRVDGAPGAMVEVFLPLKLEAYS